METELRAVREALRTVESERDRLARWANLLQQQRDIARDREEFCYDHLKRVEKELLIELKKVKEERDAAQAKLETVEQERDAANERAKLLSCPCIEEFECEEC